jgi:hypothetical protein
MRQMLRDWWRGWSDEDLANVLAKVELHGLNPGAIIPVTMRELRAHRAYTNEQYPLRYIDAGDLRQ